VGRAVAALAMLAVGVTTAACSDNGGDEGTDALCALVGQGGQHRLFEEGFDPTDRSRAVTQLRSALVELGELRAASPSSARDAVDDEVHYLESLLAAVESTDPDDPAAMVAAVNGLDEEREAAEAAARELAELQARSCGAGAPSTATAP
jgi:uncharacterized membrane protein YccC